MKLRKIYHVGYNNAEYPDFWDTESHEDDGKQSVSELHYVFTEEELRSILEQFYDKGRKAEKLKSVFYKDKEYHWNELIKEQGNDA